MSNIQNKMIGLLRKLKKKNFWDKEILDKYAYQPSLCPCCKVGKFNIRENTKNKILNPYIIVCCNKKYKKKIISENFHFFRFILKSQRELSALLSIILLQSILIKYKKTLSYDTIRSLLFSIRKILADAIKLLYIEERIGGPPETNEKVIIDKCNFIHNQNNN